MNPSLKSLIVSAVATPSAALATVTATYLPHGSANPTNPAWAPSSYRDIPWWFEDTNPYWANNNLTPGAADAYDIAVIYAARLNRNNQGTGAAGYEAAIINSPAFSHIGNTNPYGSPGGAFGTPANSISWGNNQSWDFTLTYRWNSGAPTASLQFVNGTITHTATASLGTRISDFINGTGPYLESHQLNDVMMRFASIGTYSTNPSFSMSSVTIEDMQFWIDSDPAQDIVFYDENGNRQNSLTTRWDHVPGGTSDTNPRQVEFLVINDLLPSHQSDLTITGRLTFAWEGNVNTISNSGVMFEMKLGDLDFFPDAAPFANVPEPTSAIFTLWGILPVLIRKRKKV